MEKGFKVLREIQEAETKIKDSDFTEKKKKNKKVISPSKVHSEENSLSA